MDSIELSEDGLQSLRDVREGSECNMLNIMCIYEHTNDIEHRDLRYFIGQLSELSKHKRSELWTKALRCI